FVVNSAYAEKNKVDPNDPCDVYFCMAGMVYGNKSECQPAIKKYHNDSCYLSFKLPYYHAIKLLIA
ncbi:hypothetical protein MJN85_31315, partial [Salmonella enterica subsp. enterica serovar Anatum]|nr:hypothetical protein [Salmonella enterica subsp. enterica serovar Anatum]